MKCILKTLHFSEHFLHNAKKILNNLTCVVMKSVVMREGTSE